MKRPLGVVALIYAAGLLFATMVSLPLFWLFGISLVTAGAALAFRRARSLLLAPLVFLTAWTNLACHTAVISPNDLRVLVTAPAEIAVVRGKLVATPSERIYVRNGEESSRTLARLQVTALRLHRKWHPAYGAVAVTAPGTLPKLFFAGQQVEVSGVIAPPRPPVAPGLFDYRSYLRHQGIYFQLKTDGAQDWALISSNTVPPLSDRFRAWAKSTLARGLPEKDEALRLLWAMALGARHELPSEEYVPFVRSGTMHIFAISGLHIALLAGILVSLLRALQVSRAWCGVVVIPLIWFYAMATGWQPSAIRSTVMMSIVIAGWSLKRPGNLLNSLAAAALVLLVWDPRQLFQAGFQLSFVVVASIALVLPPLERARDRWLSPDPLLPSELIPRWKRWFGLPLRLTATWLTVSLAAWLGSWPLTAYYFHLFSPVTLLANVLIVPLSSAALASCLGSLLCGAWFSGATILFNNSAWFWMTLMMRISDAATRLPGAWFYVPAPRVPDFAIYYTALFAVLSGLAFSERWRRWTVTSCVCVVGFYGWQIESAHEQVTLTALPLNGGSAIYCDAFGHTDDLLVDCGNAGAVQFVLEPFLRAQGVNSLQSIALTHGDARHIGGFEELEELIPIRQVVTSPLRFRSPKYRKIVSSLRETPARRKIVSRGDRFGFWTVLYPDGDDHVSRADDGALVLAGEFGGTRVLLFSDLARDGQETLLARKPNLRADIAIACLPDYGEALCDGLLDAIQPKLVIITDSEFPATKRATVALRRRLKQRNVPIVYTRNSGAVTMHFHGNEWRASTMNGANFSGTTGDSHSE